MDSSFPYCANFGFDRDKVERRLAFLYLSSADHALAQQLQQAVIVPHIDQIIERFYDILLFQPESRRILNTGTLIQQLKQTQRDYLLSLGIGFDQPAYFEERLRIGMAHAWAGVPISLYQCAYRALTQLILDVLPAGDAAQHRALTAFVLKITMLDMSLAIETYHASQLSDLEDEVARVHHRADQLHRKAVTDALTGLLNHEHVFLSLQDAIGEARHSGQPLSLLMADLDYFKRVNDTYGHLVGDGVLQEVAARILASLRAPDKVGRYGGEEFLIVLASTDTKTALQVAERIRARIAATPINIHGQRVAITISVGVTTLRAEDDFHTLVKRADEALYHAKGEGRDRVVQR